MAAIEAGLCSVAVIAYGSTQRTVGRRAASAREWNPYETPFRPFLPASAYAMAASRHMHEFGTTREQMAEVAVAAREWALLNPAAWEKKPLTVADVLGARQDQRSVHGARYLPGDRWRRRADRGFRRTRAEPAQEAGLCAGLRAVDHACRDLVDAGFDADRGDRVGAQAYHMAKLAPREIGLAMLYDAFTINTILFLEDLGFCPKGEGGRFVSGGAIAPGGRFAVNTNGGGLSYCHPGMYGLFLLIEAVEQLRGEAGARQVAGVETAIAHGNGGVLSAQASVILGTAAAL